MARPFTLRTWAATLRSLPSASRYPSASAAGAAWAMFSALFMVWTSRLARTLPAPLFSCMAMYSSRAFMATLGAAGSAAPSVWKAPGRTRSATRRVSSSTMRWLV